MAYLISLSKNERMKWRTQSIIVGHAIDFMQKNLKLNAGIGDESFVHGDGQLSAHIVKSRLSVENEDDGFDMIEADFPRIRIELTSW